MILYVNGDSHSAGAELIQRDGQLIAFTEDDSKYWNTIGTWEGRRAHPDCVALSYGQQLANSLEMDLICDAESGSSNDRIIRTTIEHTDYGFKPDLIVIGWSTWEREEWLGQNGKLYQINASGIAEDWPDDIVDRYRRWVVSVDFDTAVKQAHTDIYVLHMFLRANDIDHIFFNCFQPLYGMQAVDWHGCFIDPYSTDFTYYNWCTARGYTPVRPGGYHLGADAHSAWADLLYASYSQKLLTR